LRSQLRGPGARPSHDEAEKSHGAGHEIASRYAPPASTKFLGPEKGSLRSAPEAARLGGEKHDNTSPGKRKGRRISATDSDLDLGANTRRKQIRSSHSHLKQTES
jgi:hypothetical protein